MAPPIPNKKKIIIPSIFLGKKSNNGLIEARPKETSSFYDAETVDCLPALPMPKILLKRPPPPPPKFNNPSTSKFASSNSLPCVPSGGSPLNVEHNCTNNSFSHQHHSLPPSKNSPIAPPRRQTAAAAPTTTHNHCVSVVCPTLSQVNCFCAPCGSCMCFRLR